MNATSVVRPEQSGWRWQFTLRSRCWRGWNSISFTTLKDGPRTALQVATALGVDPIRLNPLLYALVAAGLLTIDGERFNNTPEASHFLVRGRPNYIGMRHHAYRRRWQTVLRTAESIRTGVSEAPRVYAEMSDEQRQAHCQGLHTSCEPSPRSAGL